MKERVLVSFVAPDKPWGALSTIFADAGLYEAMHAGPMSLYALTLPRESQELRGLLDGLRKNEIDWLELLERSYTDDELRRFPFLVLISRKEQGLGGPTYGTEYDLSTGCVRCGSGATQTSPLFLRARDLPETGGALRTTDGEIVVAHDVQSALSENRMAGGWLRRVHEAKSRRPLDWWQIVPEVELPPMAPSSRGVTCEGMCPVCQRDGHFATRAEPYALKYGALAPDDLPDLVRTRELFGVSRIASRLEESHFAQPLIVMKPTVLDVLRTAQVRSVEFQPVELI